MTNLNAIEKEDDGSILINLEEGRFLFSDALTIDEDGNIKLKDFTAGSVLFAGTNGIISEDNTNLFYNDSNNSLGLGTNTPEINSFLTLGPGGGGTGTKTTLTNKNGGIASPSAANSESDGDKWVFWNSSDFKGAIGFDDWTFWFQSSGSNEALSQYEWYMGATNPRVNLRLKKHDLSVMNEDDDGLGCSFHFQNDVGTPGSEFTSGRIHSKFDSPSYAGARMCLQTPLSETVFEDCVSVKNGETFIGDGGVTNYVKVAQNGNVTLHGTARVEKHIVIPVGRASLGGQAPTLTVIGNYATLVFSQAVTQSAYVTFHTPDDWAVGTDMEIHCHWVPTNAAAGDVVWDIDYSATASEANELISAAGTNLTVTDSTQTLQNELLQTSDMTIIAANIAVNDAIGICVSRDTGDGADTYATGAGLVYLEIKYLANKLGELT